LGGKTLKENIMSQLLCWDGHKVICPNCGSTEDFILDNPDGHDHCKCGWKSWIGKEDLEKGFKTFAFKE
jgi:hypothetical protein